MRTRQLPAVVVSVVAHGVLVGVVAWWPDDAIVTAHVEPANPLTTEPAPVIPIEVALVDVTSDERPSAPAAGWAQRGTPKVATGAQRGSGEHAPATGGSGIREPGPTGALGMRGRRHDLAVSTEIADRVLAPRPLPDLVKPTGKLRPDGRGAYIRDRVTTVIIAPDGTARFDDEPDFDIRFSIPKPSLDGLREIGKDVAHWYKDPLASTRVGTTQDLPRHLQAVPGSCSDFNDLMCDAPTPGGRNPPPTEGKRRSGGLLSGKLGITDYLHRKFVGDPYSSRKLKLLDDTRAERIERGTAFRAEQLERSAELMQRNLEALWRATSDRAERRDALFTLWDECTEGDGPAGEAGERARAMVIAWIRARLPFSEDEIARFDANRSSTQPFAP